ncbi:PIF1-like helicase [Medicago truncatula]|uniref:PIF1-like helicase n=1 Tax=Medicago truncatula TaxID=3880 RepID=A0A072TXT4_MEDTR|nr:PIF1-like helicase [Medicago truncatula]
MRLKQGSNAEDNKEIEEFSNWLLSVGEGKISEANDDYADIPIPNDMLILEYDDPVLAVVESTYPNFLDNYKSYDYLKNRAILASIIEVI